MDCHQFLECLDGLVDGTAAETVRQEAGRHAAGCARCAALFEAWLAPAETRVAAPADDLTPSILARTSGAPCRMAAERLPDYVGGAVDDVDADLLRGHLEHCAPCRALAAVLADLPADLQALGDLDPGPAFTASVVRATTGRKHAAPTIGARFEAWWSRLLDRPRLGFELAYVGTLLVVLVFGNPATAVQAASARTYTLAEAGLNQVRTALPSVLPPLDAAAGIRAGRMEAIAEAGNAIAARKQSLEERLLAAWEQAWARYASFVSDVRQLASEAIDSMSAWWARVTRRGEQTEPAASAGRYPNQTGRRPSDAGRNPAPDDAWNLARRS